MKKKIKIGIYAAIMIAAIGFTVGNFLMQQSQDGYESEFFMEFVEKCADDGGFELRDGTGNPAPQEQSEEFQALYEQKEYRRMQEFLLENHYSLGCKSR